MAMVELVATTALQTFRDLLVEESKFLASVGDNVDDVHRKLNRMHCFLKDADKRKGIRNSSESVQLWFRELEALAIEAEQVLEIYAAEVMSRRQGKHLMSLLKRFSCILCECATIRQTGKKAQAILSRMSDLTSKLDTMAIGESSTNAVELSRKTYGHEIEEHFVGMKDDLEHLIPLVTSDDRSKRVISICGMGGLGKTTLARKIYQANKVRRYFDATAWICVSQTLRQTVIFKDLLEQLLDKESREDLSEDGLVRKLYKVQKEKKCLVVLDDVWETEHWNILSRGFPIAESNCKVLITSRNENVASSECVYKLKQLSEDEGWELLQKIALPVSLPQAPSTTDLQNKEEMGREIVRKCGFLPLAISVMGGILRQETNLREWEMVCRNMESYLRQGKGMGKDQRVARVLDLSYYALPYHLKPTFLYLAAFREDEEIDVEELYLIWMAEGLISFEEKGKGETLRDVAECYLCELASRCMVQVKLDESSRYRRYSSCRLHDLVRELSLLKAKEERFLVVEKDGGSYPSITETLHRVAINQVVNQMDYLPANPNLRALMIRDRILAFQKLISIRNMGSLKYLKILVLENLKFKNGVLPKGSSKMVLLKHLRICNCRLKTLPRAVCKLPYLRSMFLEGMRQIPNVIHRMRHLTYLHLPRFHNRNIGSRKLKLHGLTELVTLIGFDSLVDNVMDLIRLEKLSILQATLRDEKSLHTIVDHISSQQDQYCQVRLKVFCNSDFDEGSALLNKILLCKPISGLKFVAHASMPISTPLFGENLVTLKLQLCEMVEDPMETLGNLPVLRDLELAHCAFVGTEMVCKAGGFSQLRHLNLRVLNDLVHWEVEEGAMPQLSSLMIYCCTNLEMIPDGLKFITSLQELIIELMPKEFIDRIAEGGADYDKIKHVPSCKIVPL